MSASVQAWKIDPGTLVVLRGWRFESETAEGLVDQLADRLGHHQFVLLFTDEHDPDVRVVGPSEDLRAAVETILDDLSIGVSA